MDDQSVVEYFEKFSAHAFGDTSSVMTTCSLVGPDQRLHPCSFCFTIKRDVFDIPMMSMDPYIPRILVFSLRLVVWGFMDPRCCLDLHCFFFSVSQCFPLSYAHYFHFSILRFSDFPPIL